MSRYSGKKCVICDKEFGNADDIVVCPDCGTPYHRDCYNAAGKCVADGLHASGKSWHSFQIDSGNIVVCKYCEHENTPSDIFCEKCGKPTRMQDFASDAQNSQGQRQNPYIQYAFLFDEYCGLSPEEDFDGVKLKEIADFIGPNKRYYIPIFKHMKDTGKKVSISWPAILFPHYFFAYRKMYFPTFLAIVCYILVEVQLQMQYITDTSTVIYGLLSRYPNLLKALTEFSSSSVGVFVDNLIGFAYLAASILFALFANWLYYRHCIKRIKSLKAKITDESRFKEKVKSFGGTSFKSAIVAFILLLPFIALAMAENMMMLK